MSLLARQNLVNSKSVVFQRDSQRVDLVTPALTQTGLIALLLELIGKGHNIEVTAVKTDHHDDSNLGEHCHFNGYCADLWPLASQTPGDYLDSHDSRFQQFLRDVDASHWTYQIGLAGEADWPLNTEAAGPSCFSDTGGDHVHIGSQE